MLVLYSLYTLYNYDSYTKIDVAVTEQMSIT